MRVNPSRISEYPNKMPKRSKSGKFRPSGTASKIKFDVLPPQGEPEVSAFGFVALFIGAILGALLLVQAGGALATMAAPLAGAAIILFLVTMAIRALRGSR